MDCSVIFYSARKTSFCEKALRKCLAPLHLRISTACFANGARQLGERLIEAFSSNEICVVVGGEGFSDDRSVTRIISNAAAAVTCSAQADSFFCCFPTSPRASRRSCAAI